MMITFLVFHFFSTSKLFTSSFMSVCTTHYFSTRPGRLEALGVFSIPLRLVCSACLLWFWRLSGILVSFPWEFKLALQKIRWDTYEDWKWRNINFIFHNLYVNIFSISLFIIIYLKEKNMLNLSKFCRHLYNESP